MHSHMATETDLSLGLTPSGLTLVPARFVAPELASSDGFVSPWRDDVLDVSKKGETTPRWRRFGVRLLQGIVLAELAGVAIVVLGVPLALTARGIVELVAWLGRTVVP